MNEQGKRKRVKTLTSIELSPGAIQLREAIAKKLGITKAAVIEMALRVLAEREGIKEK